MRLLNGRGRCSRLTFSPTARKDLLEAGDEGVAVVREKLELAAADFRTFVAEAAGSRRHSQGETARKGGLPWL